MIAVDVRGLDVPWELLPAGFDALVEWAEQAHPDRVHHLGPAVNVPARFVQRRVSC